MDLSPDGSWGRRSGTDPSPGLGRGQVEVEVRIRVCVQGRVGVLIRLEVKVKVEVSVQVRIHVWGQSLDPSPGQIQTRTWIRTQTPTWMHGTFSAIAQPFLVQHTVKKNKNKNHLITYSCL